MRFTATATRKTFFFFLIFRRRNERKTKRYLSYSGRHEARSTPLSPSSVHSCRSNRCNIYILYSKTSRKRNRLGPTNFPVIEETKNYHRYIYWSPGLLVFSASVKVPSHGGSGTERFYCDIIIMCVTTLKHIIILICRVYLLPK